MRIAIVAPPWSRFLRVHTEGSKLCATSSPRVYSLGDTT
jgi:hypothetical protein